jgi:hypothetical protein
VTPDQIVMLKAMIGFHPTAPACENCVHLADADDFQKVCELLSEQLGPLPLAQPVCGVCDKHTWKKGMVPF